MAQSSNWMIYLPIYAAVALCLLMVIAAGVVMLVQRGNSPRRRADSSEPKVGMSPDDNDLRHTHAATRQPDAPSALHTPAPTGHAPARVATPPRADMFPPSVAALLRADPDSKIPAIKEYREVTGSSLLAAKNAVEAWLAAGNASAPPPPTATPMPPPSAGALPATAADGFPESAAAVLRADRTAKILAIKEYRNATRCGLAEAKDAVEAWMDTHL